MSKYLILVGPSGSGKTTVIEHLLKKPVFVLSVSYTTRKIRPGERDGVNYNFTTEEDFVSKIKENFFLEHTEFNGCRYGTPCMADDPDKIVIFDIEIDGFKFFKKNFPRSFFCLMRIERSVMESRLRRRMMLAPGEEDESTSESSSKTSLTTETGSTNGRLNEQDFTGRMETYEWYRRLEDEYAFDFVVDNSGTIEETCEQIDQLADAAIDHFQTTQED